MNRPGARSVIRRKRSSWSQNRSWMQLEQFCANGSIVILRLLDWGWAAKMSLFHCHATASIAYIFHFRQLVFADVLDVNFRCTAETAFFFIPAGIAQMSR
jgi:hypothetical protein